VIIVIEIEALALEEAGLETIAGDGPDVVVVELRVQGGLGGYTPWARSVYPITGPSSGECPVRDQDRTKEE
jgi:hypothetical protein